LSGAGKAATFQKMSQVIANGESMEAELPCSLEAFLVKCGLRPSSVVVEHNGNAVSPSEFPTRTLSHGDRLWIAHVYAGG
jgi:sulfur carrier protein